MRQASWIAFLLLTVGLLTYEASLDQQELNAASSPSVNQAPLGDEGSWPSPPPTTDEGSWPEPRQ